jgi:hypothetical protein
LTVLLALNFTSFILVCYVLELELLELELLELELLELELLELELLELELLELELLELEFSLAGVIFSTEIISPSSLEPSRAIAEAHSLLPFACTPLPVASGLSGSPSAMVVLLPSTSSSVMPLIANDTPAPTSAAGLSIMIPSACSPAPANVQPLEAVILANRFS